MDKYSIEKRIERLEHCVSALMCKFFQERDLEKYK
tara:strand:+ start:1947 stop:2051 length:105 start_codon:yes stop_codon:yes gene_type:complete